VDQSHLGSLAASRAARAYLRPLRDLAVPQQREGRIVLLVLVSRRAGNLGYLGVSRFLLPLLPVALAASVAGIALITLERWTVLRALSLPDHRWIYFRWLLAMAVFRTQPGRSCGPHHRRKLFAGNSPDYQAH